MLRFERRCAYKREIAVRLRTRDPLLSRGLLTGLCAAGALHLAFFLLIKPLSYHTPHDRLLPPTQVVIDLGSSCAGEAAFAAVVEGGGALPHRPAARPALPELASGPVRRGVHSRQELACGDFSQVRRRCFLLNRQPVTLYKRYQPATVALSGPLAAYTVIDDGTGTLGQKRTNRCATKLFHLLFDVELDEREGELFWVQQTGSSGHAELDQKGEEIVRHMRFAPNSYGLTTKGCVEVCFEVEGGNPSSLE